MKTRRRIFSRLALALCFAICHLPSAIAQSVPIKNAVLQGTLNGTPSGGTLNLGSVTLTTGGISFGTGGAATTLTNLGATTVGGNLLKLTNPGAVRFLRINANNTVTDRTAAELASDLSLVPGTNVQAYDPDLTTYAGITPSANVQTLLGAADFAAIRTSLSLGTLATKDVPVCTSYARNGANQTLTDATTVTLSWPTAVKADASFNGTTFTAPATGYADITGIFDLSCTPALGDSSKGNLTVLVRDATAGANVQIIYDAIKVFFGTLADTSQHINTAFPLLASVAVTSGHAYQIFCTWDNGGDDAATQRGFIQWEMKP